MVYKQVDTKALVFLHPDTPLPFMILLHNFETNPSSYPAFLINSADSFEKFCCFFLKQTSFSTDMCSGGTNNY